jgi:ubiquitin C
MFSKTTTIRIDAYDSVKSLKMKIQDLEGYAPDLQRLIFNGKQLEDGKNLHDYKMKNWDTIHLVARLLGG